MGAQALQRLTLGDLVQMYETAILPQKHAHGHHHRALSAQVFAAKHWAAVASGTRPAKPATNFGRVESLTELATLCIERLTTAEAELYPPMAHKNPSVADKWNKAKPVVKAGQQALQPNKKVNVKGSQKEEASSNVNAAM